MGLDTPIDVVLPYARGRGTGLISYAIPSLDSDFTFDGISRRLKGTKSAAATVQMNYQATDAVPTTRTDAFQITFIDTDTVLFDNVLIGATSGTFSHTLTAPSELSGLDYQIELTGLPSGWTFNPSTLVLTGPISSAPSSFTLNYTISGVLTDGDITGAFDVFKFYWLNGSSWSKASVSSGVYLSYSTG